MMLSLTDWFRDPRVLLGAWWLLVVTLITLTVLYEFRGGRWIHH